MDQRTPIGGLHARDFDSFRTQVTLAEAPVDARGYVRFSCLTCPRTGRVAVARLRARFDPREGLVNILNTLKPKDCPHAEPDPWGTNKCGWCYRDLGKRAER